VREKKKKENRLRKNEEGLLARTLVAPLGKTDIWKGGNKGEFKKGQKKEGEGVLPPFSQRKQRPARKKKSRCMGERPTGKGVILKKGGSVKSKGREKKLGRTSTRRERKVSTERIGKTGDDGMTSPGQKLQ